MNHVDNGVYRNKIRPLLLPPFSAPSERVGGHAIERVLPWGNSSRFLVTCVNRLSRVSLHYLCLALPHLKGCVDNGMCEGLRTRTVCCYGLGHFPQQSIHAQSKRLRRFVLLI
jgi:hypothetical protein